MISYDFQAGNYIKHYSENREFNHKYCMAIANRINQLITNSSYSLIEIGIGEATTLALVMKYLKLDPAITFGFDISWSRVKFAKHFLKDHDLTEVKLFTANLFEIPLLNNSIDIVYTSHSIEPNGGREEEALKELYRITKRYLVLLEPAYELASLKARERIERNGYVKNMYSAAKNLGYEVIEFKLFDYSVNELNPTGIMVIRNREKTDKSIPKLVCPITKSKLSFYDQCLLYTEEGMLAYPVIDGIKCLLKDNAILAKHLLTDYEKYKERNNIKL